MSDTLPGLDLPDERAVLSLLRIATAGSVDDGKSTLVGRLLFDSRALHEDQLEALARTAAAHGHDDPDLALITDGLRAEREQGITIDVAYRYFSTPRRKFIIADTPGHLQYTRNMVTGASTADLAIVLIDARHGVVTQSRRHGYLSTLLQIPHLLVAVNKMDLVGYDESIFRAIEVEYTAFLRCAHPGHRSELTFLPISALKGDNVVERSSRMPWYTSGSLIETLESVTISPQSHGSELRLPVQIAVRPNQDFRGFAGSIASGTLHTNDEVIVLPLGRTARVQAILSGGEVVERAHEGESVVVSIDEAIDVSRGDILAHPQHAPTTTTSVTATLCWLAEEALDPRTAYILQHTTREVTARVQKVLHRVEIDTLEEVNADRLQLNEIGRVSLTLSRPIAVDVYADNRITGSFILIDPQTNNTVAAGLVESIPAVRNDSTGVRDAREADSEAQNVRITSAARRSIPVASPNTVWEQPAISREERERHAAHRAAVLWFTGLSGAGKSTIAQALERTLFAAGISTFRLDGDNVRHGLNADLGFGDDDRVENIRRVAHMARLAFDHGAVVLCTFISPFRAERDLARSLLPAGRFIEIHVDCPLDECIRRDPKGLYARAQRGEIAKFTGISSPYEAPLAPELTLHTADLTTGEAVDLLLRALVSAQIIDNPRTQPGNQ